MDQSISETLKKYMDALQFFEDNIDTYIYIYDLMANRVYFTDKIRERFPLPAAGDNGFDFSNWINIVYYKDRDFMYYYRDLLLEGKISSFNITYRLLDRNQKKVWVNVKGSIRRNDDYALLVGRVSEMPSERMVDGLTGLCSTQKFMDDMKRCMEQTDGYLMVLGIDNFKNINITHGRHQGDSVLKEIAEILEDQMEYPESLYRLDGDCFAVNFPHKQKNEVTAFYQEIRNAVKSICTVSAGVVEYNWGDDIDNGAVYQYAENALDQAKKEGKNRMIFFSADNYRKDLEQGELLDEMRASIHEGCKGFFLCYQPQVNTHNYDIYGVEALIRYESPTRGRISPMEFIPMLEQNGMICAVGEWVLRTAIAQCKAWRAYLPNLHVNVNISYIQLQQEGICETVLRLLKEAGLPGDALTLEVTESIQLHDYCYFNKIFYAWKQSGIQIAIDDFGTGYSSLSYLKSIDVDEVKIDRSFVSHVNCNAYNYRLLNNMIELAHSAKIKICCEGVETTEELAVLQDLSADILQGYLFAQPYTVEAFEQAYICKDAKAYRDRILKESNFRRMEATETNELLEELRNDEIGNIVEGMEETVYVSDVDTHELYYLNAAGRRMTGVYDYRGRKCYEVLQGKTAPCEFCTNHLLNQDEFYVWESKNAYLNRHNILKDKLIPWQGRIARLEMAIDITEKEIVSQSIQKKLRFEQAIVEASQILASETDSVKANYDVLKMVGEFCQGDRAYILRRKESQSSWELLCEWCMEGIARTTERDWMELDDVTEQIDAQRIAVPIIRNGILLAFVCVDHPRYIEEGSELVKTMVCFLGYRIIGEETREKLNKLLEFSYEDIRNHAGLGLWLIRINPETDEHELYPDPVLCKLMEMDDNLSPREKYSSWYDNVKKEYIGYVNDHMREMIQSGKITSLEYPWVAPSGKTVTVHCVGIRREDSNGMICLDGYHWVVRK